ncbi:MAG: hypothetical protein ACYSW4_05975 [Planctomycetota bacterium]|jgi:hypothetical protein
MGKRMRLSRKQLAVIDDLFAGELDEQAVLEKHKVKRHVLNRWLVKDAFAGEIERRLEWLDLQSELIIARYKSLAAAKLVQLTESEKEETARKACLDIISLPKLTAKSSQQSTDEAQDSGGQPEYQELSPETASRLLGVLAEEKD